jgi:hypothetical protein
MTIAGPIELVQFSVLAVVLSVLTLAASFVIALAWDYVRHR